jgi:hypothetical protein
LHDYWFTPAWLAKDWDPSISASPVAGIIGTRHHALSMLTFNCTIRDVHNNVHVLHDSKLTIMSWMSLSFSFCEKVAFYLI